MKYQKLTFLITISCAVLTLIAYCCPLPELFTGADDLALTLFGSCIVAAVVSLLEYLRTSKEELLFFIETSDELLYRMQEIPYPKYYDATPEEHLYDIKLRNTSLFNNQLWETIDALAAIDIDRYNAIVNNTSGFLFAKKAKTRKEKIGDPLINAYKMVWNFRNIQTDFMNPIQTRINTSFFSEFFPAEREEGDLSILGNTPAEQELEKLKKSTYKSLSEDD